MTKTPADAGIAAAKYDDEMRDFRRAMEGRIKMSRTYTEAQYSTPSSQELIRTWLNGDYSPVSIETVAKYMSKSLRIGGIKSCRNLVREALPK